MDFPDCDTESPCLLSPHSRAALLDFVVKCKCHLPDCDIGSSCLLSPHSLAAPLGFEAEWKCLSKNDGRPRLPLRLRPVEGGLEEEVSSTSFAPLVLVPSGGSPPLAPPLLKNDGRPRLPLRLRPDEGDLQEGGSSTSFALLVLVPSGGSPPPASSLKNAGLPRLPLLPALFALLPLDPAPAPTSVLLLDLARFLPSTNFNAMPPLLHLAGFLMSKNVKVVSSPLLWLSRLLWLFRVSRLFRLFRLLLLLRLSRLLWLSLLFRLSRLLWLFRLSRLSRLFLLSLDGSLLLDLSLRPPSPDLDRPASRDLDLPSSRDFGLLMGRRSDFPRAGSGTGFCPGWGSRPLFQWASTFTPLSYTMTPCPWGRKSALTCPVYRPWTPWASSYRISRTKAPSFPFLRAPSPRLGGGGAGGGAPALPDLGGALARLSLPGAEPLLDLDLEEECRDRPLWPVERPRCSSRPCCLCFLFFGGGGGGWLWHRLFPPLEQDLLLEFCAVEVVSELSLLVMAPPSFFPSSLPLLPPFPIKVPRRRRASSSEMLELCTVEVVSEASLLLVAPPSFSPPSPPLLPLFP